MRTQKILEAKEMIISWEIGYRYPLTRLMACVVVDDIVLVFSGGLCPLIVSIPRELHRYAVK